MLAAVQLDKATKEGLLRLMILASQGKINAVSIEEQIKAQIADGKIKYLKSDLNDNDISFELASTIERELARSIMIPYMDLSRRLSRSINQDTIIGGYSVDALRYALAFRLNVNDSISARYLDGCIKELEQIIKAKGIIDVDVLKKSIIAELESNQEKNLGIRTTPKFESFLNLNFLTQDAALASMKLKE